MSLSEIQTIFYHDNAPLPLVIARHLLKLSDQTWDHILLVVPTIETGRRTVDSLLQATNGKVIFPPRFATPLTLLPFGEGEGIATPVQAQLAWRTVLLDGDCPLTFRKYSSQPARESLANSFVILMRDLAAANLNIPDASTILVENDPRWLEWMELWRKYIALLDHAGLQCPAEAQLASVRSFTPAAGISKIIVAGVYDMPPLTWEALGHCETQIMIHAPGLSETNAAFDERGRTRLEFWAHQRIPIRTADIHVVTSFDDLARETAAIATQTEEHIAIISGGIGLSLEISAALENEGCDVFLPEGAPLNRHPVVRLAILLTQLATNATWKTLDALLRHPDFLESLEHNKIWRRDKLSEWNAISSAAFQPTLENIQKRLKCLGTSRHAPTHLIKSFAPLLERFRHLSQQLSASNTAPVMREILEDIYGPQDLANRPGDKDALKAIIRTLDEISAAGILGQVSAATLGSILSSLPGSWTSDKNPAAIEIEGWLELAGEDAPVIILAGLNEDLLPSQRRIDPLLPDLARGLLGLDNTKSRHARDAAMLYSAIASRKQGAIQIFSVLRAADGSPFKPSRLLLRVPENELPARVLELCPEAAGEPHFISGNTFAQSPLQIQRTLKIPQSMSVTDFASYLHCPLRYYLSKQLGMRAPEPIAPDLQAARFGTWIHEVLSRFGSDLMVRESTDEKEIQTFLLTLWDDYFTAFEDDVGLMLQREAGRMRLEQFSIQQVIARAEGWQIKLVEWNLTTPGASELNIPGWPLALRGRIDRIDARDGALRLIDYKTSNFTAAEVKSLPRSDHLVRARLPGKFNVKPDFARWGEYVWRNLQLPLYSIAIQHAQPFDIPSDVRLAYFLLNDNAEQTGIYEWLISPQEIQSAETCARTIMAEVVEEAVLENIKKRNFRFFSVNPAYDDFQQLALSQYIENEALEVAR